MGINTIVGPPATGIDYFERPHITKDLWRIIQTGSHILLVAPRRVGKTSLLFYLEDKPKRGYRVLYRTTESINNENEFFRILYSNVSELLNGIQKFSRGMRNLVGKNKITEITKDGIKLEGRALNYYDGLIKLFEMLDLGDEELIVMIDEFAETVENIITDESNTNAIRFLQKNRDLRFEQSIRNKIQFIYAGSIGLENVVSKLNASSTIDDLYPFKLPPLTKREAIKLIYEQILKDSEMELKKEQFKYLLEKIDWLVPFYIQLILEETYKIFSYNELEQITNDTIDQAIENAIELRNFFDLWITRLRKAYKRNDFNFVKETLNTASEKETITSPEIYNIAVKFDITDSYKNILNALIYDGYLNNYEDPKIYRFNSPILKLWWYKYVAN